MRYFAGLNLQDVWVFLIPPLIFIIVFGLGLAFRHFQTPESATRKQTVVRRFPDGLSERNAPFPTAMGLIIAGTVLWAFFYILFIGLYGVKI